MKNSNKMAVLPKKICAIHDLSCFGRCALTVIIPTLSAMGNQVIPMPTALLSTHTGGFQNMHFVDLDDAMKGISDHFLSLGLRFDAIYSGFLASVAQIDTVSEFIDRFERNDKDKKTLVLVDPVMGDDGKLYSTYTNELMLGMKRLCHKADVITPNLTEAYFLSDREFCDTSAFGEKEVLELLRSLKDSLSVFGNKKLVITGIPYENTRFATYAFDFEKNEEYFYSLERVRYDYPGTGDLFASLLLGRLVENADFYESVRYSSDLVARVMEFSALFDTPKRDGVALEAFLGEIIKDRV